MKKLIVVLLALILSCSLFASNLHFVLADIGQHPDFLGGFIPTYVLVGAGYKLPQLIEGNTTDIRLLVGEGYSQRLMWLDIDRGENNYSSSVWDKSSALRFNVWQNELSLRFIQGFLQSPVEGKDLLTLTASVSSRYERYYSSAKFAFFNIHGNLCDIVPEDYSGSIYPELNGRKDYLGLEFGLSLKLDMMEDTIHTNNGIWSRIDIKYGPKVLNAFMSGHGDYYSLVMNTVGAVTVKNFTNDSGKSYFSVTLIDRVNASYTSGSAVPSFVQGPVSLGRKVRGFNTYTYGTEYSVVNNFDIRLAGPGVGIDSIAPRVNLFIDCGYGWGKVFNTTREEKNFLASVGAQFEVCFFDFIDLGWEVNVLLVDKEKYTQPGRVTTNFTFFLDF